MPRPFSMFPVDMQAFDYQPYACFNCSSVGIVA